VSPLTANQEHTFKAYYAGQNIVAHGYAGTGKTFISLYLALNEILSGQSPYEKIIIIRSVVPSRDMGFLPGSAVEKAKVYEEPYREICNDLFGKGDGYDILTRKGLIQFTTTSFLRGLTFQNAIVIIDESQNLSWPELYTTLTRMGDTSRLILCGDFRQTDLSRNESGLPEMLRILKSMGNITFVDFGKEDIVRSAFVKELIIRCSDYQDQTGKKF
jgi:phosphate starvation-inducible PhoH-like protein